jgi:hypothetical protein
MSPWLAPAPSQVTLSRRRWRAGTAVIAASSTVRWSAVVLLPVEPGRSIPASASVVLSQYASSGWSPNPLKLGSAPLLTGMAGHHAGIQPDADHALQYLVRHPPPRDGAVPGLDHRPGAAGGVDRPGDPGLHARPAGGDLAQRPPRCGHRRDQAMYLPLVSYDPEVADHLRAIRDHAGQVRSDPAPVMHQQPVTGQRPGTARRSAANPG